MAGTYPDVPGHRMAYDRDGSEGFTFNPNDVGITVYSAGQLSTLNDEDFSVVNMATRAGGGAFIGFRFPELRDVVGWFIANEGWGPNSFQYSADTTNGKDGTWTSVSFAGGTGAVADYRTNISAVSVVGARAIRWRSNSGTTTDRNSCIHIYGSPSTGEALDRLRFWNPATAVEVGGAYFDWGDIARFSSVTRGFRIHNPSSTLTAMGVSVTMEALTDTSPSNVGQHEFSTDGGTTWASSASLGDLGPGATSPVITLRRVTSGTAALNIWATRMVASAASWA